MASTLPRRGRPAKASPLKRNRTVSAFSSLSRRFSMQSAEAPARDLTSAFPFSPRPSRSPSPRALTPEPELSPALTEYLSLDSYPDSPTSPLPPRTPSPAHHSSSDRLHSRSPSSSPTSATTRPSSSSLGSSFFSSRKPQSGSQINIRTVLHALHADELVALAQPARAIRPSDDSYSLFAIRTVSLYFKFLLRTWLKATGSALFSPSNIVDRISIFAFAFFASWIVFFLMLWCLFTNTRTFQRVFSRWSHRRADSLSLINAAYPEIFRSLSVEQIDAAKDALDCHIYQASGRSNERVFNLDVAKLLLQVSALMYERTSAPIHRALNTTRYSQNQHPPRREPSPDTARELAVIPGALLATLVGADAADLVAAELHSNAEDDTIAHFAQRLGLKFFTVSELNTPSSAFCALFYDPRRNFIILGFKGTAPTEFEEWIADFSYEPQDAGNWIRGFGKVHGGFMDRIFPRKINAGSGGRLPYDTIREAVKATAKTLLVGKPEGTEINLWFTGHSLGCAMSSLAYARAINEPKELRPEEGKVRVRDAYLFAAPICVKADSVHGFNNRMNHNPHKTRTMWRITNGKDAVATSLPNFGDYAHWNLSPYNMFSFAHLGTEIVMRSAPQPCLVRGDHVTPGTHIRIESALPGDDDDEYYQGGRRRPSRFQRLQNIPLLGRLFAHGTAFYWDQLSRVGTGLCEWADM